MALAGDAAAGPALDHGASLPCRAVPMMIAKNPAAIKRMPPPRLELSGPDGGRRAAWALGFRRQIHRPGILGRRLPGHGPGRRNGLPCPRPNRSGQKHRVPEIRLRGGNQWEIGI